MDCCTSAKDDKINDETDIKNVKQEDSPHEHSHGYGRNLWKMVVVMVLFTIIMILLRR